MGSDTILNSVSKTNVFFNNSNDTTVDFCLLCRHRKLRITIRNQAGWVHWPPETVLTSPLCCDESTAYYVKKSTAALISLSVNIAKQDVGILSLASLQRVWLVRLRNSVLGTRQRHVLEPLEHVGWTWMSTKDKNRISLKVQNNLYLLSMYFEKLEYEQKGSFS